MQTQTTKQTEKEIYEVLNASGETKGVYTMSRALTLYDSLGGCAKGWKVVKEKKIN